MRRILPKAFAACALAAATLPAIPGCADNDSILFVRQVMAVESPECFVQADPTGDFRTGGALDVLFARSYSAVLLVGNQLVERGSRDQLRTESNRIVLKGAEVRVFDATENQLIAFTVPASGFVDPASGATPGFGLTSATLIPTTTGDALFNQIALGESTTVTVTVRVFGDTLGGEEIESAELVYPIQVCKGCLVFNPSEADDPATPGVFECRVAGGDGDSLEIDEVPCAVGQDALIDCRLCCANFAGIPDFDQACSCVATAAP